MHVEEGKPRARSEIDEINPFQLPEEIIQHVISFMDIRSLSNMVQTSHQTNESLFSTLLISDKTWANFVEARFKIKCSIKRPKIFGGPTWKAAYRSLMCTNRIPRCRLITGNKKVIFAKPFYENYDNGNDEYFDDTMDDGRELHNRAVASSSMGISLWVTIGHTEDRNTRMTSKSRWNSSYGHIHTPQHCRSAHRSSARYSRTARNNHHEVRQRYIELHLCLQNTKSSGGTVEVDFSNAFAQVVCSRGTGESEIRYVYVRNFGEYRPKLLYHSRHQGVGDDAKQSGFCGKSFSRKDSVPLGHNPGKVGDMRIDDGCHHDVKSTQPFKLSLNAFDFAIVAVYLPCTPDMIFETDFLSQAILMNVPVIVNRKTSERKVHGTSLGSMSYREGIKTTLERNMRGLSPTLIHQPHHVLAAATFLVEEEIWNYYMELPGGCLALSDSNRSMRV